MVCNLSEINDKILILAWIDFFARKPRNKVYVPPEVYVPLQDNLRFADITAMYVEQFDLFCITNKRNTSTYIAAMYMGGINPIVHFNQHWYIGISLEWILEVFSFLLCFKGKKYNHYLFPFCCTH